MVESLMEQPLEHAVHLSHWSARNQNIREISNASTGSYYTTASNCLAITMTQELGSRWSRSYSVFRAIHIGHY